MEGVHLDHHQGYLLQLRLLLPSIHRKATSCPTYKSNIIKAPFDFVTKIPWNLDFDDFGNGYFWSKNDQILTLTLKSTKFILTICHWAHYNQLILAYRLLFCSVFRPKTINRRWNGAGGAVFVDGVCLSGINRRK